MTTAGAVLALALMAAACGSDAEELTKSEYIAQADAICTKANEEIGAVYTALEGDIDFDAAPTPEQFSDLLGDLTPIFRSQMDSLRELKAPTSDQAMLDGIYDLLEGAVDEIDDMVEAAADGDQAALDTLNGLSEAADPFEEPNRLAREYGMLVCGESE